MNNFRKGVISGAAGFGVFGLCLAAGVHPEITSTSIEACAFDLGKQPPNASRLPETCENGTQTVFDTIDVPHMVVSAPNEAPYEMTSQYIVMLSPDEYRQRAYELKAKQESSSLPQKAASFIVGAATAATIYYEWAIDTPERRNSN